MDDEADIGFIDTHTEGIGSYHYLREGLHPLSLYHIAFLSVEASMIERGSNAIGYKPTGHLLGATTVADIDNARAAHTADDTEEAPHLIGFAQDHIGQIRAEEAGLKKIRLAEKEPMLNIVDDSRGGCSRKGKHRDSRLQLTDGSHLEIRRAEIVAPLRDTVSLVDSDERDLHLAEMADKDRVSETFRGDVEQFEFAIEGIIENDALFDSIHTRDDAGSLDASVAKILDLIFHQRYERGDHQGKAVGSESRQLIADRLAATSREQCQGVASAEDGIDNLALQRTEGIEMPIFVKQCKEGIVLIR